MEQKQQCNKAKCPLSFVVLFKTLRSCRQTSGVH